MRRRPSFIAILAGLVVTAACACQSPSYEKEVVSKLSEVGRTFENKRGSKRAEEALDISDVMLSMPQFIPNWQVGFERSGVELISPSFKPAKALYIKTLVKCFGKPNVVKNAGDVNIWIYHCDQREVLEEKYLMYVRCSLEGEIAEVGFGYKYSFWSHLRLLWTYR